VTIKAAWLMKSKDDMPTSFGVIGKGLTADRSRFVNYMARFDVAAAADRALLCDSLVRSAGR
jgi:hypothetical protein